LELFEPNEVWVKYGFILGLKKFVVEIHFTNTNKKTNKQKERKSNNPLLELT